MCSRRRKGCLTYVGLPDRRKLSQLSGGKTEIEECNWIKTRAIYLFKQTSSLPASGGMDSRIKADHSRCNSLLHWRKAGHFCCQRLEGERGGCWEKGDLEGERLQSEKRDRKRERERGLTEEEQQEEQSKCETMRYGPSDFDCVTLVQTPLTVIDGAVISRMNICNESPLLLLDSAMGSLSLSQL